MLATNGEAEKTVIYLANALVTVLNRRVKKEHGPFTYNALCTLRLSNSSGSFCQCVRAAPMAAVYARHLRFIVGRGA